MRFKVRVSRSRCAISPAEERAAGRRDEKPHERRAEGVKNGLGRFAALLLLLALAAAGHLAQAQTLPVGDLREEQLRIQQLLNDTLSTSFVQRPVWNRVYETYMDAAEGRSGWWNRKLGNREFELDHGISLGIFEPELKMTSNSRLPVGENNAAAWYGKGINSEFTGGFYLTHEYITFSFRPQVTYQQNVDFVTPRFVPRDENGNVRFVAEAISDRIDRPYRFGPDSFWTSDRGHSSLRVHYREFEAGFSTEPLWWGGAEKYPLMMSNNAPGVKHLLFGTRAPVEIPYFGGLEFRWIGGWPEDSEYFDLDDEFRQERFMTGINVSVSPDWIPHLHIGTTRIVHFYIDEGGLTREDFFSIFDPTRESDLIERREETGEHKPRNQLRSYYARWVWPEQSLEIFGEYFRDGHNYDRRDLMMQPRHNSGYSYGFQKLVHSVPWLDFLKFHFEFTQLTPSRIDEVRDQDYFYTDLNIPQGHTNRGQVLGAAIGPGSNSYYVSLDAYKDNVTFGTFFQRWADNEHFHFEYNQPRGPRFFGDKWRHPVRMNIGARFLYGPGPFYISGQIMWTQAFNYGRFGYGEYSIEWEDRLMDDAFNVQMQLSLRYVF